MKQIKKDLVLFNKILAKHGEIQNISTSSLMKAMIIEVSTPSLTPTAKESLYEYIRGLEQRVDTQQ